MSNMLEAQDSTGAGAARGHSARFHLAMLRKLFFAFLRLATSFFNRPSMARRGQAGLWLLQRVSNAQRHPDGQTSRQPPQQRPEANH
jgi:hypothetical protein